MIRPWFSSVLLVVAFATYGGYLHSVKTAPWQWAVNGVLVVLLAAGATFFRSFLRQAVLLGFNSDLGYLLLALGLASLAIAVVAQFRLVAYWGLLVAATLLVRVDLLVAKLDNSLAWLSLVGLCWLGLGLSWVPQLLIGYSGPIPIA
ncbi:MAG: hypothetical protein VKL98_09680 [Cyanobacteriota bacterium]|nr:hypothetical protein [Cyanobacteriota bacterium]